MTIPLENPRSPALTAGNDLLRTLVGFEIPKDVLSFLQQDPWDKGLDPMYNAGLCGPPAGSKWALAFEVPEHGQTKDVGAKGCLQLVHLEKRLNGDRPSHPVIVDRHPALPPSGLQEHAPKHVGKLVGKSVARNGLGDVKRTYEEPLKSGTDHGTQNAGSPERLTQRAPLNNDLVEVPAVILLHVENNVAYTK